MNSVKYSWQSQSGVTLIISLVLLLLLTLIGVSGMKVTNLQEKMAGNDRDRSLAFHAAEAALRAGQRKIEALRLANEPIRVFCHGSPNKVASLVQPTGLFHAVQSDNKTSVDIDLEAFCQPCATACPVPDAYSATTWTDANSIVYDTGNTLLANQPRYFITYVETHIKYDPTCSSSYGGATCPYHAPVYTFVVTARGTGGQDSSQVILRSYAGGSTEFNN